jgi:ubiquinone/menaquinone biosynthesis C-methylase UbiE/uncharacterized protein YbaR (Trm112 family)
MTPAQSRLLRCPLCGHQLEFDGQLRDGALYAGVLRCSACPRSWLVRDGIPELLHEPEVHGFEGLIRCVYDVIAPFHDLGVRYMLPLLMCASEDATRDAYMRRLDLGKVTAGRGSKPVRILDVGIGGGGNLPAIGRHLRAGVPAEIWGLDYSRGMLAQCRRRLRHWNGPTVELLLGDAHALPFADGSFDRVLHVGGIATYRDPARALAEMARVAKRGTPVVVVDEQLDRAAPPSLWQWLAFRAITAYDPSPHAPTEVLPAGAIDVRVEQASSFYYALSFRVP